MLYEQVYCPDFCAPKFLTAMLVKIQAKTANMSGNNFHTTHFSGCFYNHISTNALKETKDILTEK